VKYSLAPFHMLIAEETGASHIHVYSKVLSVRGKNQVRKQTSREKGCNVTLMFCMNPTGQFILPLFTFPRAKINQRLMLNRPAKAVAIAQSNGQMTSDIFLAWSKEFMRYVYPLSDNPVILIVDAHSRYKNLQVIGFV